MGEGFQTGHGFASYRLRLKTNRKARLALYLPDFGPSYRLYVNGEILAEVGKVGESASDSQAEYDPRITLLPESSELDIILHISNFQNRWGGFWNPIELGRWEDIASVSRRKSAIDMGLALIAGVTAVYHLFLFFFRRQEKGPLFFSLYCFLIVCRTLMTGERLGYRLLSGIPWEISNRLEYVSVYLAGVVLYAFLNRYCPTEFWRRYGKFLVAPIYLSVAIVLVFPNEYYTLTLVPLSCYVLVTTVPIWTVLLGIGTWRKYEGVWILLLGYLGIMFGTYYDVLIALGFFRAGYLIPNTILFLIISYSILISKIFSSAFEKSNILSLRMKSLVSSTREIMLSSSYSEAARATLDILKQNGDSTVGRPQVLLLESSGKVWKRYTVSDQNSEPILEKIGESDLEKDYEVELRKLGEPIRKNRLLLLPIMTDSLKLILCINAKEGTSEESNLDWLQGIAYALFLSLQNVSKQDREKLAVLGELSAEIVHDIGHHIMLIQQNLRGLEGKKSKKHSEILSKARKETDALANLSYDILDFSKNRIILDLKSVNISEYFDEIRADLDLFFLSIGREYDLKFRVLASGRFRLDPLRIRRLVFNLAKNAIEAIRGRMEFSVSVEKESDVLYLIFQDNGPGLSKEGKLSLFDSNLQSKKPRGTGLGFPIIRKIVIAHGGEILVDSEKGKGTRFTVLLPG